MMMRAIAFAAILGAGPATAATYELTYLTESSGTFAVALTGDLQADGDTVVVSGIRNAVLDGVPGPSITFLESFLDVANEMDIRDPVVTLSGAVMDFIACTEPTCSEEGFLFTFAGLVGGGGAGLVSSPAYGSLNENFVPERYRLERSEPEVIPLPTPALLLLSGLAAVAACGRRRR